MIHDRVTACPLYIGCVSHKWKILCAFGEVKIKLTWRNFLHIRLSSCNIISAPNQFVGISRNLAHELFLHNAIGEARVSRKSVKLYFTHTNYFLHSFHFPRSLSQIDETLYLSTDNSVQQLFHENRCVKINSSLSKVKVKVKVSRDRPRWP
jgi:hypothetical protein